METVLLIIHYLGIISFSVAGAMVAVDHESDCIGVVLLSVITCFAVFLINDIYGFCSWRIIKKRQGAKK